MLINRSENSDGGRQNRTIEPRLFFISIAVLAATETITKIRHFNSFLADGIFIRLAEIILLLLVFMLWGGGLSSLGLGRSNILHGLKRGLIWSFAFGIIVSIGFFIIFLFGKNPFTLIHARLPGQQGELIHFLILAGLVGPVAEEIFFRGILYGFLRRWGVFTALSLSTLIFVSLHASAGLTQAAGGILFAAAYEKEGSLMAPITIHILGNMAIFMVSLLF